MAARVVVRKAASEDAGAAVDYYQREASESTSNAFVEALEESLDHLALHPHTGSLRFAFDLGIRDLRSWRLPRFPYLIFYIGADDLVDIWRILHASRDIPASLRQ